MTSIIKPARSAGPPANLENDPAASNLRQTPSPKRQRRIFSTSGLAGISAQHPWRVLVAWTVILVLAVFSASGLSSALSTGSEFTGKPESQKGLDLLNQRLANGNPLSETIVVRSETLTVDDPAFEAVVARVSANLAQLGDLIVSAPTYYQLQAAGAPNANQLVSADRKTALIPVTFNGVFDEVNNQTDKFLNAVKTASEPNVRVLTVGSLSANKAANDVASSDLSTAERFALPATLVVLILVFGALIAAGVPLVLAFVSILIALGLTALVGRAMDLSFYVVNMVTMIGLAVGIDYALFIITRYREERRRGLTKQAAIERSGATASKAVLFSGSTVVFALSGMLLMPSTTFRSLGAGAVLVVIVAVLAMLTLVPALVSLIGDRLDWPRRHGVDSAAVARQRQYEQETIHPGFWGWLARVVMTYPTVFVIVTVLLLASAAVPYFSMKRGTQGIDSMPLGDVSTAYAILKRDFSAGQLAPYEIVIDAQNTPQTQASITRLTDAIGAEGNFVPSTTVEWNGANDLAVMRATLTDGSNSPLAYSTLKTLREDLIPSAFAGTSGHVYVTGDTAFNADFFHLVDQFTPLIFTWVLGLSFLLLLVAFRSIVVATTAILMNLLSVGAAYGLMVLVFQNGYLHNLFHFQKIPTIESWVPILLFCILFGLSMDYQVFLLSRIREHYDRNGESRASVAVGLQATARLITGAALIMVVVFVGFASGQLSAFEQLGFGMAVAVTLDATVVRSLLVPSVMTLLGNANWYLPSWLHWLPDVRIEGNQPEVESASSLVLIPAADD